MLAAGVIAEYNPFHNGHLHHINETRRLTGCAYIVAVMSGHFVQRGEPALCGKWRRVRMALENGADLVLELPLCYAVAGADYFARGAVSLLRASGVADALCFGSECGDLAAMDAAAQILHAQPPAFTHALRRGLSQGLSFAAARGAALSESLTAEGQAIPDGLLTQPNNNLGIEYLKALRLSGASLSPLTIPRGDYAAASTIRGQILRGEINNAAASVPPVTLALLAEAEKAGEIAYLDALSPVFKYLLGKGKALDTPDMGEGLANRFHTLGLRHAEISQALAAIKTKRYAYTRLQRAALHSMLGITAGDMAALEAGGGPPYLRVLGFRKAAEPLLKEMARRATLPVVTRAAQARGALPPLGVWALEKEAEAARLYGLACAAGRYEWENEYSAPIVRV